VKEYPFWYDTLAESAIRNHSALRNPQSAITPHSALRTPQLDALSRRADVVIVGAGYTGLAAARHLAGVGATVLVLERESIGWGASSRNGGQVLTGLKLDAATLLRRFGERRARQLFDAALESIATLETLIAGERIDCEYRRTGHLQAAAKPSHFEALVHEQALLARVFNHHVQMVPRAEQRSEIGTDVYYGAMVDERSGALNPAKYVHGLAEAAGRKGATIVPGVAVTGVRRHGGRWRVVTASGEVEANDVLFATNGYTDGAAPALRRRLVPIGSYIIATAPLPRQQALSILPRGRVAFDSKHFLHYFRVTSDRRLLFGGRAAFTPPTAETTARAATILSRDMTAIFPELAGTSIEFVWGGNVAFTRDQMPRAGMLEGAFYAAGYCGHGIAMATFLGQQIARRIGGEAIAHPLFDDAFSAIPLYTGRPWFLPLVGAYYRVKDWLE
jgi:glycine/D-amino acid oxidase-like deaminating enzyme